MPRTLPAAKEASANSDGQVARAIAGTARAQVGNLRTFARSDIALASHEADFLGVGAGRVCGRPFI